MSRARLVVAGVAAASLIAVVVLVKRRGADRGAAGLFSYAEVKRTKEAPPARFAAPLPHLAEVEAFGAERFPPRAHVADLLCAGDADMWRRARAAIAESPGATPAEAIRAYHPLVRYCGEDGCFAKVYVGEGDPPAVAALGWMRLAGCKEPEVDALFRRPDVPAPAILARAHEARWNAGPAAPDPERVVSAALAVLREAKGIERRLAAFDLAGAGRRGVEALLELHDREVDPERRHDLAMALSESDDPRARGALAAACARRADPVCGREPVPSSTEAPREVKPPPPEALVDRLRALRLLPPGELRGLEGATAADALLLAAGRALGFDVETGSHPNEHDSLLRQLAALAPGALGPVVFEEVAPALDDEATPYVLRAWAFGERWETGARNLGDWYDVEACVGLLDAIARARGIDARWLVLETGDQSAIVVAGPEAGLRAAVSEGLLRPARADGAMESGKAFEEKVIDQLERGR